MVFLWVSIQSLWVDCSNLAMTSKRWSVRETTPRWGSGLWAVGRDLWVTIKFLSWIETILSIIYDIYIYIIIWARLAKVAHQLPTNSVQGLFPMSRETLKIPNWGEGRGRPWKTGKPLGRDMGEAMGIPFIFIVFFFFRGRIINIH